jgi:hypothetical protein
MIALPFGSVPYQVAADDATEKKRRASDSRLA